MNSINKNQPEQNREDLRGEKAIEKIREIVNQAPNCFFCTAYATGESNGARPMNVRKVDHNGHLWFLSANDSHKADELSIDPSVRLFFQGSTHSDFLELNGRVTVHTNREKIEDLWEPVLQTWFTEGIDDPRILVIQFVPTDGYYWDTKHGGMVAGIKMFLGAILKRTLDDSIEGKISVA